MSRILVCPAPVGLLGIYIVLSQHKNDVDRFQLLRVLGGG